MKPKFIQMIDESSAIAISHEPRIPHEDDFINYEIKYKRILKPLKPGQDQFQWAMNNPHIAFEFTFDSAYKLLPGNPNCRFEILGEPKILYARLTYIQKLKLKWMFDNTLIQNLQFWQWLATILVAIAALKR